jgi:hypothetical protein
MSSFTIANMAVHKIRETPSHLPFARLYIDDILEIESVVREALGTGTDVRFEYIVDESVRISTLEDLLSHGGYATDFALVLCSEQLNVREQVILRLLSHFSPSFNAPYDLKAEQFDLYGRVRIIFEDRAMTLTNALRGLPAAINTLLIVLPLICVFISIPVVRSGHQWVAWFIACVSVLSASALWIEGFRKSRVYFARHREDALAKKQRRSERVEKLIWMIFGVAFGCLGTILTWKLMH